jgi:hypothetical protein
MDAPGSFLAKSGELLLDFFGYFIPAAPFVVSLMVLLESAGILTDPIMPTFTNLQLASPWYREVVTGCSIYIVGRILCALSVPTFCLAQSWLRHLNKAYPVGKLAEYFDKPDGLKFDENLDEVRVLRSASISRWSDGKVKDKSDRMLIVATSERTIGAGCFVLSAVAIFCAFRFDSGMMCPFLWVALTTFLLGILFVSMHLGTERNYRCWIVGMEKAWDPDLRTGIVPRCNI